MDEINEAEYGMAYLRFLATGNDRPDPELFGLTPEDAQQVDALVESAVENAYAPEAELLGSPVNPADFETDPVRGKTIIDEVDRLCRQAFMRRNP